MFLLPLFKDQFLKRDFFDSFNGRFRKRNPAAQRVAHTSLERSEEEEEGCQSDQVDFSTAPAGSVPNSR